MNEYSPFMNIHSDTISNNWKVKTSQISINGWTNKQKCYIYTIEYYSAIKTEVLIYILWHGWTSKIC
jgi:hypothetical protein